MEDLPLPAIGVKGLHQALSSDGAISGGGSVAALAVLASASVLVMVARASRGQWQDAPGAAAQAQALVRRSAPLFEGNTAVYRAALSALREPSRGEDYPTRDATLGEALHAAAEVPLAIAEVAAQVAELGAQMAVHAEADRRADAVTSALLAQGSARAAAALVRANLTVTAGDERVRRAETLVEAARSGAERASRSIPG